jgi:hypothetical protein
MPSFPKNTWITFTDSENYMLEKQVDLSGQSFDFLILFEVPFSTVLSHLV